MDLGIYFFSFCQWVKRNTAGLKASSRASGRLPRHSSTANFMKINGKNSSVLHRLSPLWRSDWTLSVAGSDFYSETAPPCRLWGGSPVCCVGVLPPAHNTAKGILHTIALLFGCHLHTICIWPHSKLIWARRFGGFYLHGLKTTPLCFFIHSLLLFIVGLYLSFVPPKIFML